MYLAFKGCLDKSGPMSKSLPERFIGQEKGGLPRLGRQDSSFEKFDRLPVKREEHPGRQIEPFLLVLPKNGPGLLGPVSVFWLTPGQGRKDIVSATVVADEVEDREVGLYGSQAKPPADLLEEDSGGVGGAKEHDPVDFGDVDSFVKEVDNKKDGKGPLTEFPKGRLTLT